MKNVEIKHAIVFLLYNNHHTIRKKIPPQNLMLIICFLFIFSLFSVFI